MKLLESKENKITVIKKKIIKIKKSIQSVIHTKWLRLSNNDNDQTGKIKVINIILIQLKNEVLKSKR